MKRMKVVGLMSGTSLDGIDVALCEVESHSCRVLAASTVEYSDEWRQRLASVERGSALEYATTNVELGRLMGEVVKNFLEAEGVEADLVASHGHTIFHQPEIGLTTQIGDGDAIAAATGLPVVSNFRTLDVALGGQGAPLVPIGDELLFSHYDACLNLGGIANISFRENGTRVAFDICPCNMVLNKLALLLGMDYDDGGRIAQSGRIDEALLQRLEALAYYKQSGPKSLGKEWVMGQLWPIVEASGLGDEERLASAMRTMVEHVARRIGGLLTEKGIRSMLATGGGVWNSFLMDRIKSSAPLTDVVIPDALTVNYKEAMIFAMLGYRRYVGLTNTLSSVTGARVDSVGGVLSGFVCRG